MKALILLLMKRGKININSARKIIEDVVNQTVKPLISTLENSLDSLRNTFNNQTFNMKKRILCNELTNNKDRARRTEVRALGLTCRIEGRENRETCSCSRN